MTFEPLYWSIELGCNFFQFLQLSLKSIIQIFFDSMADAMAHGDRAEIRGLCSFFVKQYKTYTGRNPKTGEKVMINPKKLPFFKAGKELKERVDN